MSNSIRQAVGLDPVKDGMTRANVLIHDPNFNRYAVAKGDPEIKAAGAAIIEELRASNPSS